MQKTFIIDFDSTFVQVEALDKLAEIVLRRDPDKEKKIAEIKRITRMGMEGTIPFPISLGKRLELFTPEKKHIALLLLHLKKQITPSILSNKEFFKTYHMHIYIISGGFSEYIYPIVKKFGISRDHVIANTFLFDRSGRVTGFDRQNPLSRENGKVEAVRLLQIPGEVYAIGDGITDYHLKKAGLAKKFFAFTENISRPEVNKRADHVVKSFDEFLYALHLPRALSYPKSKMTVLLLENIHEKAVDAFIREGYSVEVIKKGVTQKELLEKIRGVSLLGIRSKTEITKEVLMHAEKLLAIGAFCIGTNQIDLSECTRLGIAVFNAPYSNTRSVAEMIIGEIIILSRRIADKSKGMHKGIWDKSSKGCHEVRGRKLGIIGYGHIGSQVSVLAESLGMDVYFYNTSDKLAFGNAKKCNSLEELVKIADVITVHVSGKAENRNLLSQKQFLMMKDGVLFLNASRGFVVDIKALAQALQSGKVAGAAIDVYPEEPEKNGPGFISPLQNLPNSILTPHLGSGTDEGQENIGAFVSEKLITYVNNGNTTLSVNFPNLQLPLLAHSHRFIHIHKNTPGILAEINGVLSRHGVNIEGQYLQTNAQIGYVITDVYKEYDTHVIKALKDISETVKFRVLY